MAIRDNRNNVLHIFDIMYTIWEIVGNYEQGRGIDRQRVVTIIERLKEEEVATALFNTNLVCSRVLSAGTTDEQIASDLHYAKLCLFERMSAKEIEELLAYCRNANLCQICEAIEVCREKLVQSRIIAEKAYPYLILRAYSKAILTCCEIYTLLLNGYPEGAMSLVRSLYEAMIIIGVLLEGKKNNDAEMCERLFTSVDINRTQMNLTRYKWMTKKKPDNSSYQDALDMYELQLKEYTEKYGKGCLRDYWWSGANSFDDLVRRSRLDKVDIYKMASNKVHFNAHSILTYLDEGEDTILLGSTDRGHSEPMYFLVLYLCMICKMIREEFPQFTSDEGIEKLEMAVENVHEYRKLEHQDILKRQEVRER